MPSGFRICRFIAAALLLTFSAGRLQAQEAFAPHLRFAKGDVQHIRVTLNQTIDQTVKNAKQHQEQTTVVGYTLSVGEVDNDQTAAITFRFDSVRFTAQMPAGHVDYDSEKAGGQVPPLVSGLAALGQTFSASVDQLGVVKQVGGTQQVLEAVLAHLDISDSIARIAAEKTLRQELEPQNLMQNLQNLFSPLPDHPVTIGESWVRTSHVKLGLPLTVQSTFTLLGRAAGVASVEVTGRVATARDAAIDLGTMKLTYDLQGDQNGSLQIVEATGQTQVAELAQHLGGSATLRNPNAEPQTIAVTIDSSIKVERR